MEKIFAQMNHGRWIGICPRCQQMGILSAVEIKPFPSSNLFVCPEEYPGMQAKMLIPHPQRTGAFLSVPDENTREQAARDAIGAGDVYNVVFPPDQAEIERALRFRPRHAQNWSPGTTVDELHQENERHGVKHA